MGETVNNKWVTDDKLYKFTFYSGEKDQFSRSRTQKRVRIAKSSNSRVVLQAAELISLW